DVAVLVLGLVEVERPVGELDGVTGFPREDVLRVHVAPTAVAPTCREERREAEACHAGPGPLQEASAREPLAKDLLHRAGRDETVVAHSSSSSNLSPSCGSTANVCSHGQERRTRSPGCVELFVPMIWSHTVSVCQRGTSTLTL